MRGRATDPEVESARDFLGYFLAISWLFTYLKDVFVFFCSNSSLLLLETMLRLSLYMFTNYLISHALASPNCSNSCIIMDFLLLL